MEETDDELEKRMNDDLNTLVKSIIIGLVILGAVLGLATIITK